MYKSLFKDKKVIIFDLNGTVVDTTLHWERAFSDVMNELGVYDDYAGRGKGYYIGYKIDRLLNITGASSKGIPLPELIKFANEAFLKGFEADEEIDVRPGFYELVFAVLERGMQIALISNADKYVVDRMLKKLLLDETFDFVIAGDMVKKRKPDPSILNAVAANFKVKNKECLVFEDSYVGINAAHKAGMATIAILDPMTSTEDPDSFPDTVAFYTTDFEGIADNMDEDPNDIITRQMKQRIVDEGIVLPPDLQKKLDAM